ncbi:hypothetical protein [Luteimicrobium subarcticum]|uniref:Uncharacterized protein n=1 Tax=Luteimicrobium subarcticum TaxID=620910 RepID=A0A2M8WUJ9_9MICO|nr:hypothetical protein [Luteimicrobium subarcticum]PJI94617.1 hypothetical protein CLV34_0461 [Luteimicrobium subarcticum]
MSEGWHPGPAVGEGSAHAPSPVWRAWTVGDRVVVRRRLAHADGSGSDAAGDAEHLYTDVLGVVTAVDDAGVTVRPDPPRAATGRDHRADPVRIDAGDIALGKRVPPRPVRRNTSDTSR